MKYELVRHFMNEIPEDAGKVFDAINNLFTSSKGIIEIKATLHGFAKVTVVGVVTEGTAGKYLKIGVSRCAVKDTFSKKQGKEYAKWRALNSPTLRIKMEVSSPDEEIQELFLAVTKSQNKKFRDIENVHLLEKIPEELKLKFVHQPVVRPRWTPEQIEEAKLKAREFALQAQKDMENVDKNI